MPGRVLAPLGIGIILSLLGDATLYTVLPDPGISSRLGLSAAMVGLLLGINRLTRIISNGVAGVLYDRLPRRWIMIGSMFLGALSTGIYAIGNTDWHFILGRIAWGIAWSGIWIGANSIVLDISTDLDRGALSGKLQMWFYLGVGISSFSGGIFTDLFGFRLGMGISAILSGLAVLLWIFFLPETRPLPPPSLQSNIDNNPPTASSKKPFPWKAGLITSLPYFAVRVVFAGVLSSTTILWLRHYFENGLEVRAFTIPLATLSGTFIAFRVLVSMSSAPITGSLSDKIGKRWSVMTLLLLSGVLGVGMMSINLFLPALIGALIASITTGGIPTIMSAIIGDSVEIPQRSRVLSVTYTIGDLGSAIGPILGLTLVAQYNLVIVYQGCAALYAVIALIAFFLSLRERRLNIATPNTA